MNSRLVIVTEASNAVGKGFLDRFLQEDNTNRVAVSHSGNENKLRSVFYCRSKIMVKIRKNSQKIN